MVEAVKTLIETAREQGHLTYDDINEVVADGVSPDDLDTLYTKLQSVGIEVTTNAEVEMAKPNEPEAEEERSFESLDDPVRMYMNQMGKVPLLTREQEVEVCKRIEEAELEMKRLVYRFGFTAKEHSAVAQKTAGRPPKERFDRIVVESKVASHDGHLRESPGPFEEDARLGRAGGRALCPPTEGRVAWPSRKTICGVSEARRKAAGHLSQILLQTKGNRGHDRGGH
jgi:RNA polymerase primary sigma factor